MYEDVIPEKTKALIELCKIVEKDLPDNEKKEKIVKALVKQGISKPRAVELADQVMKEHEEMKPTPEEEKWFEQINEFIEKNLAEGKPKEEIVEELMKMDIDRESATDFVDYVITEQEWLNEPKSSWWDYEIKASKSKYARHVWYGTIWILVGILLVITTFLTKDPERGGRFIVGLVLIIYGIVDFLWGKFGLESYRDEESSQDQEEESL